MQMEDCSVVFFSVLANIFFFVSLTEEHEEVAVKAGRGFDYIRNELFVSVFLIDVAHVLL